jgi:hypothetical protein
MNKYIYESYRKLNEAERATLIHRFKDSPTVVRFIDFIKRTDTPNFKTVSAIDSIYKEEKNKTEFRILENRFFKLRKKLADELGQNQQVDRTRLQTSEEQRFLDARHLVSSENKELAYKQLVSLEKECWEKNIFELLPSVIDQLIFCNQSFNRFENNKALFLRQEIAIGLLRDINILGMTTRRIYETHFTKGVDHIKKDLQVIRKLATKHREYPRFLLCYYHIAAYYKLGSEERDDATISRHLTAYKKLQRKYPMIPLMQYKANYIQFQHMHFNQMMISWHFSRCEFEEAYLAMKEVWNLIVHENSIFRMYKSESSYFNMITSQCMTKRYAEALQTTNDFVTYLKINQQTDKLIIPNVLKAWIYSDVYPVTFKMNSSFLSEQVDEYIRILKKTDNRMISLDQTMVLKAKLLILEGQYEKAIQVLKDPAAKQYLEVMNLNDVFFRLINILSENNAGKKEQLSELGRMVQSCRYKAKIPAEYMNIHWLENYLKYQFKNL